MSSSSSSSEDDAMRDAVQHIRKIALPAVPPTFTPVIGPPQPIPPGVVINQTRTASIHSLSSTLATPSSSLPFRDGVSQAIQATIPLPSAVSGNSTSVSSTLIPVVSSQPEASTSSTLFSPHSRITEREEEMQVMRSEAPALAKEVGDVVVGDTHPSVSDPLSVVSTLQPGHHAGSPAGSLLSTMSSFADGTHSPSAVARHVLPGAVVPPVPLVPSSGASGAAGLVVKPPGALTQTRRSAPEEAKQGTAPRDGRAVPAGPTIEVAKLRRRKNSWEKRSGDIFEKNSSNSSSFQMPQSTVEAENLYGSRRRFGDSGGSPSPVIPPASGALHDGDTRRRTKGHEGPEKTTRFGSDGMSTSRDGPSSSSSQCTSALTPDQHRSHIKASSTTTREEGEVSSTFERNIVSTGTFLTSSAKVPPGGPVGKFRALCRNSFSDQSPRWRERGVGGSCREHQEESDKPLLESEGGTVFRKSHAFSLVPTPSDASSSILFRAPHPSRRSHDHHNFGQYRTHFSPEISEKWEDSRSAATPAVRDRTGTAAQGPTVVFVTVKFMSQLHADSVVVHPFVRVWLVNCVTGVNYVASGSAIPCAITHPFDLRTHNSRSPVWEAEVALHLDSERTTNEVPLDAALLFEVVDCGNETIHGYFTPRSGLYPICWGYYMLHDCYGRNGVPGDAGAPMGRTIHVQMFRFPSRTPWYMMWLQSLLPSFLSSDAIYAPTEYTLDQGQSLLARAATTGEAMGMADHSLMIPALFYIFKNPLNRKVPYAAGLTVSVRSTRAHEGGAMLPRHTEMHPYEEYLLNQLVSAGGCCSAPRSQSSLHDSTRSGGTSSIGRRLTMRRRGFPRMTISVVDAQALRMEYYRRSGERVLPPSTAIQTSPIVGRVSCMVFSHSGTVLAIGVTRHLQYTVELLNPTAAEMPCMAQLHGHTGHIHSMAFRYDDTVLVSCSSDKTVRVWQPENDTLTFRSSFGNDFLCPIVCVSTLPHSFPVYCTIFHQGHVLTSGYSNFILAWRKGERTVTTSEGRSDHGRDDQEDLSDNSNSASSQSAGNYSSTLHLTYSAFNGGVSQTMNFSPSRSGGGGAEAAAESGSHQHICVVGQLVSRVSNEDSEVILSLASNEGGNRVWSVSSSGLVTCWRAIDERQQRQRDGRSVWQMSVRRANDCSGTTQVQVRGAYAVATCATAPLVYIFDAASGEQTRIVNTTGLGAGTSFAILPDGLAFVAGTTDGKLHCWECNDGGLCSPVGGYAKVQTKFAIERIAWAEHQQIAAFRSPAPVSVSVLNATLLPSMTYEDGGVAGMFPLPDLSQMELTLITVVGTKRDEHSVILSADRLASEDFCAMFGGDVKGKQKVASDAARVTAVMATRRRKAEGDHGRRTRLYDSLGGTPEVQHPAADLLSSVLSNTMAAGTDVTEASGKMSSIINFWKSLVVQHRHDSRKPNGNDSITDTHEGGSFAFAVTGVTLNAAQRTVQYLDVPVDAEEDDNTV